MSRLIVLMLASLLSFTARAQGLDQAEQLLRTADARFETGLREREAASSMAGETFLDAARIYESIANLGVSNPNLLIDAGNSYLLGGDIGRAVLCFRRADLLRPHDHAVRSGLAEARERVQVHVPASSNSRITAALTSWRAFVPASVMLLCFGGFYVAAWIVACWNVIRPNQILRPIGVSLGLVAGVVGGLILLEKGTHDGKRSGVVIVDGITARNGPSVVVYEPTFSTPLRPGVELNVLEQRDGWMRVRLADGRETWLPSYAVELVKPPHPPERSRSPEIRSAG
ncbi:MAG: hypothetical protein KF912_07405 [Phycisphaeraceae bacterium]|nr:hypothetical protein [Phycisphaeraceae bacterium]MBX3367127.1 hypothetical protein [Phycisphaeraceae bacterium]